MNEFKVGDEVWFFWTYTSRSFWGEDENPVFPKNLEIEKGKIVYFNENKDTVHVYVDGCEGAICKFGCVFHMDYFFKSKQEAIEAMIKQLEKLKG